MKRPAWHVVVAYIAFAAVAVVTCMNAPPVRGHKLDMGESVAMIIMAPSVAGVFAGRAASAFLADTAIVLFWGAAGLFVLFSGRRLLMVCAYVMLPLWAAFIAFTAWLGAVCAGAM